MEANQSIRKKMNRYMMISSNGPFSKHLTVCSVRLEGKTHFPDHVVSISNALCKSFINTIVSRRVKKNIYKIWNLRKWWLTFLMMSFGLHILFPMLVCCCLLSIPTKYNLICSQIHEVIASFCTASVLLEECEYYWATQYRKTQLYFFIEISALSSYSIYL